jgi:hypothetical protein
VCVLMACVYACCVARADSDKSWLSWKGKGKGGYGGDSYGQSYGEGTCAGRGVHLCMHMRVQLCPCPPICADACTVKGLACMLLLPLTPLPSLVQHTQATAMATGASTAARASAGTATRGATGTATTTATATEVRGCGCIGRGSDERKESPGCVSLG